MRWTSDGRGELLQISLAVDHIRGTAVKRVLKLPTDLAENEPEKYATFWTEFDAALKEDGRRHGHRDGERAGPDGSATVTPTNGVRLINDDTVTALRELRSFSPRPPRKRSRPALSQRRV